MTAHDLIAPLEALLGAIPLDLLQPPFMRRAVLAMLFLAPPCAVLGTLVTQFRMAFFSDAVAHSAFTGIALGLLVGIDPALAMPAFAVFVGILTIRLQRRGDTSPDTTLGVVFSASVALGLAVISAKKGLARHLPTYLYGDVLSINHAEILTAAVLAITVFAFLSVWYNRLLLGGLHRPLARVAGIPCDLLETVFAALLSLVVACAIRAVGILLVTALLVIPATAARRLSRSAGSQVWIAIAISLVSSFAGLATSALVDVAAGASMILWSTLFYVLSLLRRA